MKAIEALGFESPTEIQEKSIPMLMEREVDFIGQAQTGTGKTAAFTLPILEKIDHKAGHIQAMIIAPTRELANQICQEIGKLSKFEPVKTLAVYGGVSIQGQLKELRQGRPQIIVGTPGRMLDVMNRGAFKLEKCKYVVLDEADEMLDMGFFEDVQTILAEVPEKKIWMFSATMPRPILKLINEHFCNPELVKTTKKVLTADAVSQQYCIVNRRNQAEALCRFLDYNQDIYAIVFVRTRVGVKELTDELNNRGFTADALSGEMSQDQRDLTMRKFKQKKISLLICTDVAARGIDVTDLTHVINFSLPQDNESYVHRIGRTGRGGSKGTALSIIESSEARRISQIERITQAKIEQIKLPTVEDIVNVLTEKAYGKFESSIEGLDVSGGSFDSFKTRFESIPQEQILKGLYSYMLEESLKRYKNARTLDVEKRVSGERSVRGERNDRGSRSENGAQEGYQRYHITLGREAGMQPGELIRLVAKNLSISGGEVGKISVMNDFSFFEIPETYSEQALGLGDTEWNGESFKIQVAKGRSEDRPRGGRSNGGDRGGRSGGFKPREGGGYTARTGGGSRDGARTGGGYRGNRSEGSERSERPQRSERSERPQRSERSERPQRSERPEREGNSTSSARSPRRSEVDGNSVGYAATPEKKSFRRR